MSRGLKINENNVTINFSDTFCSSSQQVLRSEAFRKIMVKYNKKLSNVANPFFTYVKKATSNNVEKTMTNLFLILLSVNYNDLIEEDFYKKILIKKKELLEYIENLYDHWRSYERYATIVNNGRNKGIQNVNFIDSVSTFNNLILKTYRIVIENILGSNQSVYRQLSAGINSGLVLNNSYKIKMPKKYEFLKNIPLVEKVVLRPPFIVKTKKNTRKGIYKEAFENPLNNINLKSDEWYCIPAKVGQSLALVYFHNKYMAHGISLCNLFDFVKPHELDNKKPDLIYVFGYEYNNQEENSYFYSDKENDVYVGIAYDLDDIDYFGYMKKMLLTLHNVRMIDKGILPIHGAMFNIQFKNNKEFNIVLIGDSGAGKSETLEAFKFLTNNDIRQVNTIFDDMGSFVIENNKLNAYGTEIGAFVRLDDLDTGYAYDEMDRAIFINPNQINARLIIPVANYDDIMAGTKIDLLLYVNNYTNAEEILRLFKDKDDALKVFKQGRRGAKGTTAEVGIVESYFANPFGPAQRQEQTDILLDKYFSYLLQNNVAFGELHTKLAIPGNEYSGPKAAAERLLKYIKEGK